MVKSREDTIAEFNEQVNMSSDELEAWLKDPMSRKAGTGVGLESAKKIIEILKKNPTKDPSKYDDEDIEHMRKVAGYNKRHLAQEEQLKDTKTREELETTKSTISLKNWGHDPLKTIEESETPTPDKEESQTSAQSGEAGRPNAEKDKPLDANIGSKRKHDEATATNVETFDKPGKKDVAGEEKQDVVGEEDAEADEDEDSEEERVRKKSKTASTDDENQLV